MCLLAHQLEEDTHRVLSPLLQDVERVLQEHAVLLSADPAGAAALREVVNALKQLNHQAQLVPEGRVTCDAAASVMANFVRLTNAQWSRQGETQAMLSKLRETLRQMGESEKQKDLELKRRADAYQNQLNSFSKLQVRYLNCLHDACGFDPPCILQQHQSKVVRTHLPRHSAILDLILLLG